jgi:PBSX family phage terminase large subunit
MITRQKKNKVSSFQFKKFSRKQKKLLNWWQHKVIRENDIIIADGAIRSGKTISMIVSFMQWSQYTFSNESFIIAGKSIGSLKRNVIKPLLQILTEWNWNYNFNRSENYIEIGDNIYYLFGANNEASQDVLAGLTAAGAYGDEIALFPKSFVEQMIGRCSIEGSKIFCNCNPAGPYHYFKIEFIDKAKEKNILYLHFDMNDNLTLSEKVKDRYKRMFTGVFYKRYILGLWVIAEGIIFDMFNEEKHVIDTSEIKFTKYYVSCDYGVYNALCYQLWGYNKNTWYMIKEYFYSGRDTGKQKDNELYYQTLDKFIGKLNILGIIIDPSATSFIQTIKKHGKYKVKKAKNDVKEGIENTGTALNVKKIMIDKNCKNMIREFYSYMWDEKAAERGEEKPIKQNDHCCDALRYMVNTVMYRKNGSLYDLVA